MSIQLQENGTYNLIDDEYNWPIANGTRKEMLLLKRKIECCE
jgi:hypothetical protein